MILSKIFTDVLWPLWTKSLVKAGAPEVWRKCFCEAGSRIGIEPTFSSNVASLPALQRLLVNTFKPDRPVPRASDFAISIAFELHRSELKYRFGDGCTAAEIRNWAACVRQVWLECIAESPVMRARYKDIRDRHPSAVMSDDAACMPELDKTLIESVELRKAYFETFSVPNATENVFVWLPDSGGTIHCDEYRRIVVPVSLNTSQGADRGFYRSGFDYSLGDKGPVEWLKVCCLDESQLMETGQFGNRSVGKQTNHILWER
ncbi:MAG: hypothetical protein KAX55_00445 [Propionivibrio sp.]|nr:hypothetical protein [Propionivibrio sp.]